MHIDWLSKLRHLLQTLAFCLAVSAIQYAFQPEKPYEIPLVYSLAIGLLTWACIDFGRHLFPVKDGIGWPVGIAGVGLTCMGITLGYLGGTLFADRWFGFSSWGPGGGPQLRVSLGITLLAGIVATYYFHTRGKAAWLQARVSEVHGQATEAQLKLLQAQLEPHMLFNTLANLRALIGTDPERAQQMLDRMIAYLRATLSASRSTEHPLENEFERLADYLELMAVRMGPRLAYTLDLPDALRTAPVPPLLLQPLVENAIRHGLEPQVEGGHITVRASTCPGAQGPLLVLEVHDTGAGLPGAGLPGAGLPGAGLPRPGLPATGWPAPLPGPHQGFGLTQVRERLATLHGAAGTLELRAANPGGTRATITFPLHPSTLP